MDIPIAKYFIMVKHIDFNKFAWGQRIVKRPIKFLNKKGSIYILL